MARRAVVNLKKWKYCGIDGVEGEMLQDGSEAATEWFVKYL